MNTLRAAPGPAVRRTFLKDPHFVLLSRPTTPAAEHYRRVRLNLEHGTPTFPAHSQVIVVTSAVPGEGKTTSAVNLGLAFAEDTSSRTLLIDADLRRPSLSRSINPEPAIGLAEILSGAAPLDAGLIEMADSKLCVLPSGAPSRNPLELLQTSAFETVVAELRRRFGRVVIDTPPTVPFTDAAVIAAHADASILIIRANATTAPLIRRARESLAGARGVGAVLNDVVPTAVDRYYDRYDEYATEE